MRKTEYPDKETAAREAAVDLARLAEGQLCLPVGQISPVALRLFIQAHWSRVSMYAHAIHDAAESPASADENEIPPNSFR